MDPNYEWKLAEALLVEIMGEIASFDSWSNQPQEEKACLLKYVSDFKNYFIATE